MSVAIIVGDSREVLRTLPDQSVHCCVTSPPYFGLRDYGVDGQIGLEPTPDEFVAAMVDVFREVRRVLRDDGTLWLNLGDSYAGSWGARGRGVHTNAARPDLEVKYGTSSPARNGFYGLGIKPKDLIGIPWMCAFALRADGWYLRSEVVWAKPNGMLGSQIDRPTSSHETVFLLSKSRNYWSDFDAIKTPPRESTLIRTAQDVQAQAGSHRANGVAKTNGTMKAVGGLTGAPHSRHSLGDAIPQKERRSDKQRGHTRRHDGFNDRWDAMEKSEQQAKPAMMRDVWFVSSGGGYAGSHFAVMPEEIARRCILAGCPATGTVLDPFSGAGTTALVANRHSRNAVGIELNPGYAEMSRERIAAEGLFADVIVRHANDNVPAASHAAA